MKVKELPRKIQAKKGHVPNLPEGLCDLELGLSKKSLTIEVYGKISQF